MPQTTSLYLDYCSFYIAGTRLIDPPMEPRINSVAANPESITVFAMPPCDGETQITLGLASEIELPEGAAGYDGVIVTPEMTVFAFDVNNWYILAQEVPAAKTRIRIWTNTTFCPDDVIIAVG